MKLFSVLCFLYIGRCYKNIIVSSLKGIDQDGCGTGEGSYACKTVVYSAGQDIDVNVDESVGYYEENGMVYVSDLSVTGRSQSKCVIYQTNNNNLALFVISTPDGTLSVANVTILLTNQSDISNFITSPGVDVPVLITLTFCRITTGTYDNGRLIPINGQSFYVNNSIAVFILDSCTIYNVTTVDQYPCINIEYIHTFHITNTSFVNVHNTDTSDGYVLGGCFLAVSVVNFFLTESVFALCSITNSVGQGAAGYIEWLGTDQKSGNIVCACNFWNLTAGYSAAVLAMGSDTSVGAIVEIANCSFTHCMGIVGDGGALVFFSAVVAMLDNSSFVDCCTNGYGSGGALSTKEDYTLTYITRCTFVNCCACGYGSGGAVAASNISVVNVEESVFLNNSAIFGNDIVGTLGARVVLVSSYTNQASSSLSVVCDEYSLCDTIFADDRYADATCEDTFASDVPMDGVCVMPCAYTTDTDTGTNTDTDTNDTQPADCVKPDDCSDAFTAIDGVCIPSCVFWAVSPPAAPPGQHQQQRTTPATVDSSVSVRASASASASASVSFSFSASASASASVDACSSPLCMPDTSLGYPLCVPVPAEHDRKDARLPAPWWMYVAVGGGSVAVVGGVVGVVAVKRRRRKRKEQNQVLDAQLSKPLVNSGD